MTNEPDSPLGPVQGIIVYGTDWCADCTRARRFLDIHEIAYAWVDTDQDKLAESFVRHVNGGERIVPTILFPDGTILAEPADEALADKLGLKRQRSVTPI